MNTRSMVGLILLAVTAFFCRSEAYVVISPPSSKDAYTHTQQVYYYVEGNYSVCGDTDGMFTVTEMELNNKDVVVVLYIKNNLPSLLRTRSPCNENIIPPDQIIRVYTNETKMSEFPDRVSVGRNQILCIRVQLNKSLFPWGKFGYQYEDTCKNAALSESRLPNHRNERTSTISTYEFCKRMREDFHTVINIKTNGLLKTSLDWVEFLVKRNEQQYQCRKYGCRYYDVEKVSRIIDLRGQTPNGSYRLPFISSGEGFMCVRFVAQNKDTFVEPFLVDVSEAPFCNGTIKESEGMILSHGYPDAGYETNTHCNWTMEVSPAQRIFVKFKDVGSNCVNDYYELNGVDGATNNREIACGEDLANRSFISRSNTLSIELRTNKYMRLKGFLLSFHAMGCTLEDLSFPQYSKLLSAKDEYFPEGHVLRVGCRPGYVFPSRASELKIACSSKNTWDGHVPFCVRHNPCNTTLTNQTGVISSPGYPANPPPEALACNWKIKVKEGQRIQIHVDDIEGSCDDDYLLFDGMDPKSTHLTSEIRESSEEDKDLVERSSNSTGQPRPLSTGQPRPLSTAPSANGSIDSLGEGMVLICGNSYKGDEYVSNGSSIILSFQKSDFAKNSRFNVKYKAIGCSRESIRKPRKAFIVNESSYYPFGYELQVECAPGHIFPTRKDSAMLMCGVNGKWKGKIPFCVGIGSPGAS